MQDDSDTEPARNAAQQEPAGTSAGEAADEPGSPQRTEQSKAQRQQRKPLSSSKLAKFQERHARSGIVYMSRVPPHLKPLRLRQMLEGHAKLGRIYMAPVEQHGGVNAEASGAGGGSKRRAAKRSKEYGEAWIEFEDKKARAPRPAGGRANRIALRMRIASCCAPASRPSVCLNAFQPTRSQRHACHCHHRAYRRRARSRSCSTGRQWAARRAAATTTTSGR
jgi:hypothetical protein